ncbi:MAG: SurA N-terminal domain-containing protein [Magnetovibrio sp.]|nr:SurA N-terminal domain-containing protein [Magnetovibrio sp.]
MLEFMRKSANTIFIKAFLGLLVLSFAVWGIGDIFRGRADQVTVATVGETNIPVDYYRAQYLRELERMSQVFGQQVTPEMAKAMGLGVMIASRIVQETLVNEGARELGVYISDTQILDAIHRSPEFKNEAGQFDRNVFRSRLTQAGFTEDRYVGFVRENMSRNQYLAPVQSGATPPKTLVDALYVHAQEQRTADVIRIDHVKLTNVPAPSEEQLKTYHTENSGQFMAPEYRKLTAIVLKSEDLTNTIEVTEDDIQKAYDEREADYLTPEKRTLRQVLVKDEESANKAKALLDGGKPLAAVVTEVGANPAMTNIGEFTSADAANLSPDIATAVFALKNGGISAPLQSPLGWHVFEVVDITAQIVKPLADVRDDLAQAVKLDRALNVLFEQSNEIEDKLGGGMTFEEAATASGLKTVHVPAVDAQGLTPEGIPAKLPYLNEVVAEGFKLGEGQDSAMTEAGDSQAFFVVRVDGVTTPALRPLDTVKKEVTQAWDAKARGELAADLAKTITDRMNTGEKAADIAKAFGLTASTTKPMTREGIGMEVNAMPATLLVKLFELKQGDAASEEGTGAHTVARVNTITTATVDPQSTDYKSVRDKTVGDIQTDLLTQLTQALEGKYSVSINQQVIDQAY